MVIECVQKHWLGVAEWPAQVVNYTNKAQRCISKVGY